MSLSQDDEINDTPEIVDVPDIQTHYENKNLLVNELLFYISYYVNHGSASPDNIRRIVLSFFDEEEISIAKRVLWKHVKAGILKKYEKRNDTSKRTSKEANVVDIFQAFVDMDKKRIF